MTNVRSLDEYKAKYVETSSRYFLKYKADLLVEKLDLRISASS